MKTLASSQSPLSAHLKLIERLPQDEYLLRGTSNMLIGRAKPR